jgi:flagellar protein FlaG
MVMVKGIDSVYSSGHPGAGHADGLRSLPASEPAKRKQPKQGYEDPTDTIPITRERIRNILQALRSYAESAQRDLKFLIDEGTGRIVVQVIAKEDDRVIREIPPKALLDLEARIDEITGVLFSQGV